MGARPSNHVLSHSSMGVTFNSKKWSVICFNYKPQKFLAAFLTVQHLQSPKLFLPLWTFLDHRTGGSWTWNMNIKCSSSNIISLKERFKTINFHRAGTCQKILVVSPAAALFAIEAATRQKCLNILSTGGLNLPFATFLPISCSYW